MKGLLNQNIFYVFLESILVIELLSCNALAIDVYGSDEPINLIFELHLGGEISNAAISGNYAYIEEGSDLVVLNVSDPANPFEAARINYSAIINDVEVSGNYVYAVSDDGLLTISNNPESPEILTTLEFEGIEIGDITVSGNYIYGAGDDFYIMDISNPAAPCLISTYDAGDYSSWWCDVAVSGDYAYLATSDELQIINISDKEHPEWIETFDPVDGYNNPLMIEDVAVSGNYAYLACWDDLVIVNVSDPAFPFSVSTSGSMYIESIEVAGNYAYCGGDGFNILNISDPGAPTQKGMIEDIEAESITLSGDYVYCSNDGELSIIDVSDPDFPVEVGQYNAFFPNSFDVSGSYAYCAAGDSGLVILNISDPLSPSVAGTYDSIDAEDVAVSGNYAYCAAAEDGLVILDISNPEYPGYIADYVYDIYGAEFVKVKDNHTYVLDEEGVLSIINVSDPSSPILAGNYDASDDYDWVWWSDIEVSGDHAFLVYEYQDYWENGFVLLTLDISDPATPTCLGTYEPESSYDHEYVWIEDVAISGSYAYLATEEGLMVLDISNPASPSPLTTWGDWVEMVYISGNYTYINDGLLSVLDISNPVSPTLVANTDECYPEELVISGDYIYAVDCFNGFVILYQGTDSSSGGGEEENSAPTAEIVAITPNPANEGEIVTFEGNGSDPNGTIAACNWRSSIDGQFSTGASFSTSTLSPGNHTIYFMVQDDDGVWSEEVSAELTIIKKQVSDWNPWDDSQSDAGDAISTFELQEAIYCWLNNVCAPVTGSNISTEMLQEVIYSWKNGP